MKGTVIAFRELPPRSQTTYVLHLRGKEASIIDVHLEGEGDVGCVLFTHDSKPVGKDLAPAPGCHINVTPEKTGEYSLNIDNENNGVLKMTLVVQ